MRPTKRAFENPSISYYTDETLQLVKVEAGLQGLQLPTDTSPVEEKWKEIQDSSERDSRGGVRSCWLGQDAV